MNAQHTPGPWNISWGTAQGGEGHHIMDASGLDSSLSVIATVNFHDDHEGETKANAKMIAAAPDMFSLVARLANPDEGELLTLDDYRQIARATIAKATVEGD